MANTYSEMGQFLRESFALEEQYHNRAVKRQALKESEDYPETKTQLTEGKGGASIYDKIKSHLGEELDEELDEEFEEDELEEDFTGQGKRASWAKARKGKIDKAAKRGSWDNVASNIWDEIAASWDNRDSDDEIVPGELYDKVDKGLVKAGKKGLGPRKNPPREKTMWDYIKDDPQLKDY